MKRGCDAQDENPLLPDKTLKGLRLACSTGVSSSDTQKFVDSYQHYSTSATQIAQKLLRNAGASVARLTRSSRLLESADVSSPQPRFSSVIFLLRSTSTPYCRYCNCSG
ncbi:hypothetical protein AMECASPLE_033069 [Ameca splendens]|uniref:Uncharacterized protein n=1 Tax=Ameca splendens TaxID=208324 RepID=A0ABV0YTT8_9TELE